MRLLALPVVLVAVVATAGAARPSAAPTRRVTNAGLSLTVPASWHVSLRPDECDPVRRFVVSSAPIRTTRTGTLAGPASTGVVILLEEDHVNKPVGDLRRPARFTIRWRHLQRLEPCCGIPDAPASMRWFRERKRLLGFIVYPGADASRSTKSATLAVLDSLRST